MWVNIWKSEFLKIRVENFIFYDHNSLCFVYADVVYRVGAFNPLYSSTRLPRLPSYPGFPVTRRGSFRPHPKAIALIYTLAYLRAATRPYNVRLRARTIRRCRRRHTWWDEKRSSRIRIPAARVEFRLSGVVKDSVRVVSSSCTRGVDFLFCNTQHTHTVKYIYMCV